MLTGFTWRDGPPANGRERLDMSRDAADGLGDVAAMPDAVHGACGGLGCGLHSRRRQGPAAIGSCQQLDEVNLGPERPGLLCRLMRGNENDEVPGAERIENPRRRGDVMALRLPAQRKGTLALHVPEYPSADAEIIAALTVRARHDANGKLDSGMASEAPFHGSDDHLLAARIRSCHDDERTRLATRSACCHAATPIFPAASRCAHCRRLDRPPSRGDGSGDTHASLSAFA